jgi:two-component system nitrogen regulation response regulator GlnG
MPAREVIHLLLLTANPDLVELYRQDCPECVVTIAKDAASAVRKAPKHRFDSVIIESRKDWATEMKLLSDALGGTPQMVLVGSTTFLRRATEPLKALCNGHRAPRGMTKLHHVLGLEEFIGAKLRDFVRRMKLGAGSDLHSLLVKAVEKPLITLVLEETHGNQNQAAALLGLNRNTLRKKIRDLKIPLAKKA